MDEVEETFSSSLSVMKYVQIAQTLSIELF